MRTVPFVYCVIITSILFAFYIARHNTLMQQRIQAVSLERQIRVQEAQVGRLDLEFSQFLSPVRLEEIAKKSQYAHLQHPSKADIACFQTDDL
jgi:cell division protein FtsL